MSVKRRKLANGRLTKVYHYRFVVQGKLYAGPCVGCEDEKSAQEYEKKIRDTVTQLSRQKSVKAIIENFRDELAGGSAKLPLDEAWDAYLRKPRRFSTSEKFLAIKRSQFMDFVDFLQAEHPDARYISQVTRAHAESYILRLRKSGRYTKTVSFVNRGGGKRRKSTYENPFSSLSAATINRYHKTIREVLNVIGADGGLLENPFAAVPLMSEEKASREAFTQAEIESIMETAPPFVRAIFIVGFFTALRAGDICTLRWDEILWEHGIIRRKLRKTKNIVEIPIMEPLRAFLCSQLGKDEEHVLPEHAAMYKKNPSGVTYRVKKYLESLGVVTQKKVAGRTRAVSVKDIHSLRHTFCYLAGVAGIPLVVVQSIVGHMSPEMTAYYSAHADRDTKRRKMEMLTQLAANFGNAMALGEQAAPAMLPESTDGHDVSALRAGIIAGLAKADAATLERVAALLDAEKRSGGTVT